MYLTGGGSRIRGLTTRLQRDVNQLLTVGVVDIRLMTCEYEAAWTGGSMVADQCNYFDDLVVTEEKYREFGSQIVLGMF